MKAVDLFAGCGGASIGLREAGVEHLACIELNEDAASSLSAAGFPAVHGDVRDLSLLNDIEADLVWSSFPCQCFSTAGPRTGPKDDRNGWPWTVAAISAMNPKPRWFIGENVSGLRSHKTECDPVCVGPELCPAAYLDHVILPDLLRLYDWVDYRVLDCADYGVAQHRRRLIIVAGPDLGFDWPEPTHGKPTDQIDLFGRKLLPWKTIGEAIGVAAWATETNASSGMVKRPRHPGVPSNSPVAGGHALGGLLGWFPINGSVALPDCEFRRLVPEEIALIQGFPPEHKILGKTSASRFLQAGNAVPPALAKAVVESVMEADRCPK